MNRFSRFSKTRVANKVGKTSGENAQLNEKEWDCLQYLGAAVKLTKNGQGTKAESSKGRK